MRIPQKLPQFTKKVGVLAVCGAFEAHFYHILNGVSEEKKIIRHIPREEIIGKDEGLVGNSERSGNFGTVSAEGVREHNLRIRFQKEVSDILTEEARSNKAVQLYIFAPHEVGVQILKRLNQNTKNTIKGVFDGEYIKENPVQILERFHSRIMLEV